MATKDHYVSQTYLRQFASEEGTLVPYYKSGPVVAGKPKTTAQVCYEADGDANSFLNDPRILDEYLKPFENNWSEYVACLGSGQMHPEMRYGIAGYLAYLRSCTPTSKRLGANLIEANLSSMFDAALEDGTAERFLDNPKQFSEMKEAWKEGQIKAVVDRDFAHAFAVTSLLNTSCQFFTSPWLVIQNSSDTPFVTSDNPMSLLCVRPEQSLPWFFTPLREDLGLIIQTNPTDPALPFERLGEYEPVHDEIAEPRAEFVPILNESVIKSAERSVLHQSHEQWVAEAVERLRNWRVETEVIRINVNDGIITVTSQRLEEVDA